MENQIFKLIKSSSNYNRDEFPGSFTYEEKNIILQNLDGKALNIFSGNSVIGDIRVDFDNENATHKMDVFDFFDKNLLLDVKTIIIDPPYNENYAKKYSKNNDINKQFIIFANAKKTTELFCWISKKVPNLTTMIIKSFNYYVPKGWNVKEIFLLYPGGYRKTIFLEVLKKDNDNDE